jgi:hypothetical protein
MFLISPKASRIIERLDAATFGSDEWDAEHGHPYERELRRSPAPG